MPHEQWKLTQIYFNRQNMNATKRYGHYILNRINTAQVINKFLCIDKKKFLIFKTCDRKCFFLNNIYLMMHNWLNFELQYIRNPWENIVQQYCHRSSLLWESLNYIVVFLVNLAMISFSKLLFLLSKVFGLHCSVNHTPIQKSKHTFINPNVVNRNP